MKKRGVVLPETFQTRIAAWMRETFPPAIIANRHERGLRFLEEATELVQAIGLSHEAVLRVVDYVYGRPTGVLAQEVGGTMVTLAALCGAVEVDLADAAEAEATRIERPEVREKILRRQGQKRAVLGLTGDQ